MADGGYPNKIKRPRLEDVTVSMGPGAHHSTPCAELQVPPLTMNPSPAAVGVAGHSLSLETNPMNGSIMGSPFEVPPTAEMVLKGPTSPYYDKPNNIPATDEELQDLLEELTKIEEIPLNEIDLEKILGNKPDESLVVEHPQATLGTSAKPSVQMPHLESLGTGKEFVSSCSQLQGAPVQVPPSPAGLSYVIPASGKQVASPGSSAPQAKSQVKGMVPVTLAPVPVPQWHHTHQLKVLAASKQGSSTRKPGHKPSWSGLPPPSPSPSYRSMPSPHPPPPPYSPQSLMVSSMTSGNMPGSAFQGSSNAILASMASGSSAALGAPMLYTPEKLPSPALNQQPQFSPQSSILANLVSSGVKSPQGHLMSALPASNPGPSQPYRPERLSSPGLPQQSFTPQSSLTRSLTPASTPLSQQQPPPQPQGKTIFKPMATNSPKTLRVIMQQGLASLSPGAPEPFTFGNTKPLSHFVSEPGPQKMPSMPATSRQPSLLHYLQQPTPTPTPAPAPSPTASSTATATLQLQQEHDQSSLLLQQMMQQLPPRFQRPVAPDSMPSLPRQQEKQTSGLTTMTPEQRSAYIAQQMSQFQAVQEQVTSKCSQTEASPPSSQPMMPPRAGLLQNSLSPGMIPPTRPQSHEGLGVISSTPSKQQGIVNSNPLLAVPSHSGLNPMSSLSSVCRRVNIPKATPSRVPLPPSPHQLRQPCVPRTSAMFNSAAWVAAAGTAAVSREPALSRVDNSIQHLDSNSIFAKAPATVPMVALTFPPHQALAPPNQVTSGGRPGHKVSAALVDPSFSLLGSQNLRQSPVQGPVPALNATKSLQQGMASFGPMSPIQGMEPPSYVVAATAAATASVVAASQSPGPFTRMGNPPELAPYDFLPLPQPPPSLNGLISPHDSSEADFIEALLRGPGASPEEGWVCNLRLIDDILEEHGTAHDAAAQSAGRL